MEQVFQGTNRYHQSKKQNKKKLKRTYHKAIHITVVSPLHQHKLSAA